DAGSEGQDRHQDDHRHHDHDEADAQPDVPRGRVRGDQQSITSPEALPPTWRILQPPSIRPVAFDTQSFARFSENSLIIPSVTAAITPSPICAALPVTLMVE